MKCTHAEQGHFFFQPFSVENSDHSTINNYHLLSSVWSTSLKNNCHTLLENRQNHLNRKIAWGIFNGNHHWMTSIKISQHSKHPMLTTCPEFRTQKSNFKAFKFAIFLLWLTNNRVFGLVLQVRDGYKIKLNRWKMLGTITGHDWSLISECNLIVILNSCILLVSSLQIAFGKIIYLQEKAMKQGVLSVVRENRLCSPLKILARLKFLFSSSCQSKKAQSYHTLFNSMSGKNLSAWSLNAVALISPCRKIGELVRSEIWHGKRLKKKKKSLQC